MTLKHTSHIHLRMDWKDQPQNNKPRPSCTHQITTMLLTKCKSRSRRASFQRKLNLVNRICSMTWKIRFNRKDWPHTKIRR
jgi:uncharacterized Zn-finger protein